MSIDKLLTDVKEYLRISWKDEPTDRMLGGIIARGMARLQKVAGKPLDFEVEGLPRQLLLDYCRYAHSHALEMFEQNFASELLSVNLESGVETLETQETN